MTLSQHGLVLSGLVDIRHRYLRALGGLDEASLTTDAADRNVLGAHRKELSRALVDHARRVTELLKINSLTSGEDPGSWSESQLQGCARLAVNGWQALSARHEAITRYLPPQRTREDLAYLLHRALGLSLLSPSHSSLISVHTSEKTWWETQDFTNLGTPATATAAVAVPWVETLGPQRWPIVVHEVAHFFLPGGRVAEPAMQALCEQHRWSIDAFAEIVADAGAMRYIGDAYTFALAREGYLLAFQNHDDERLSISERIRVLGRPTDLLDALPAPWNLGHRRTTTRDDADGTEPITADVADAMHEAAVALVGTPAASNTDVVTAARRLLDAHEYIAAISADTDTADALAAALDRDLSAEERTGPAETVMASLVQHPLSDADIYEAFWRQDSERDPTDMITELTDPIAADDRMQIAHVQDIDTRLGRSLQSAAVHRWLNDALALVAQ